MYFWGRGALRPNAGYVHLFLKVSLSHITIHHVRQDSSRRVIDPSPRPLLAQYTTLTTDKHPSPPPPGGIRTHNPMKPAAAYLAPCSVPVAYPGILFGKGGGGLTNSVEDRGQTEPGTGGGIPLVRGSAQFADE
jgi:hypothetical protein